MNETQRFIKYEITKDPKWTKSLRTNFGVSSIQKRKGQDNRRKIVLCAHWKWEKVIPLAEG